MTCFTLAVLAGGCATEDWVNERISPVEAQASAAQGQAAAAQGTASEALARANAAHKLAEGKFLYEEVVSDDVAQFSLDSDELSPKARDRLDHIARRLKEENKNVYLEIQGFTDQSGDSEHNRKLGKDRAEAVMLYLNQRGIPASRMSRRVKIIVLI
jgi:outer membrane protein OmpA-like peptidoglycan-associated protein